MAPATRSKTAATAKQQQHASTSTNPFLLASYATILLLWVVSQHMLIPYVAHLLLLTTAILYAACHASLILREEPDPNNADSNSSDHGSSTSSNADNKETMRAQDAYQFPLVGSLSLFSLYLAFKYLDKNMVNLVIGGYFCVVGCLALTMTLSPGIAKLTPAVLQKSVKIDKEWNHPLPLSVLENPLQVQLEFTGNDAIAFGLSVITCYFYFQSKPWYLNNVLGISFCLQGIERFSLGTYKIGAILLIGLFFYDIFWVFGTEVMVSVAKSLEGPIKILFPRSLIRNAETGLLDLSLLGLGDIVIPGFFLALMLRFDAHRANVPVHYIDCHASFAKPYFHATLIAYVLGLGMTMFIMLTFNAAQPALLYLVPACLGSSFGLALWRGEVKELLEYSEEEEEEEEEGMEDNADGVVDSKKKQ
jgi:minor histocompatibility antigen H13